MEDNPDKARSLRGEALAYLKQAILLWPCKNIVPPAQLQKAYGKRPHPDMAAAPAGSPIPMRQGNYPLDPFHEKSQAMLQAIYGEQAHHPAIADNLDHLGDLALQQQATGQAIQHYQRAYKMKIALYGEKEAHVAIALSHAHIGRAHLQATNPKKL